MTDEEKHLAVMTQLQDLNTKFDKVIEPAITQTYKNKEEITKINSFQGIVKYVGSLISLLIIFITSRSFWDWYKSH